MSLVSTYIESKEGHWYRNPIVTGAGWFICWDDDEPIELVIEEGSGRTVATILVDLAKQGWPLHVTHKGYPSHRMFEGVFKPALSYFLRQGANGPPDALIRTKRLAAKPQYEGVYYYNNPNGWKP